MFGLGHSKTDVVYGVLYDIGSESVGVAITESVRNAEHPTVIFSHRIRMRLGAQKQTEAERIRAMRETLLSASLILSRDGLQALVAHDAHARISEILLTVSAPWSRTIARNVRYEGEKELKVTRQLIDELTASAETEIAQHLEEVIGNASFDYEIVERATLDVRINDYTITQPIGLHGSEISLVHITGVVPAELLKGISDVQEKIFPETHLRSHTFLLVLYCVLRDIFPDQTALTLVHVTGESTEFGIVESDTLTESISVPYGLNTIVRNRIASTKQTSAEVYSELTLYSENGLAKDREKEIAATLEEYTQSVSQYVHDHVTTRRFPRSAFILAPHTFTQLFKQTLTPLLKNELGITTDPLTLTEAVFNLGTTEHHDTNISIASRFFHKLHGCGEIGND